MKHLYALPLGACILAIMVGIFIAALTWPRITFVTLIGICLAYVLGLGTIETIKAIQNDRKL